MRSITLAGLVLLLGVSMLGSTSYARYLAAIGPSDCCRTHCHRGQPMSTADADRCCTVHLSVLPSALGPSAPDVHHALGLVATLPVAVALPPATDRQGPTPLVQLRGSPPGSLVAVHTSLLI